MSKSKINWTDQTWNPIAGCTKIRKGCENCYALRMAARLKGMGLPAYQDVVASDPLQWTGKVNLVESQLGKLRSWKKGRRIFVCSMADLFHEKLSDSARDCIFSAMLSNPQHTYQLVAKRYKEAVSYSKKLEHLYEGNAAMDNSNIHWLFSASNQDEQIEASKNLVNLNVSVKGLCLEPLVGPVALPGDVHYDWIIVGGESGPGARPMHPQWVRDIRDQCRQRRIPFFFKQWGLWLPKSQSSRLSDKQRAAARTTQISYDMYGPADCYRVGKKAAGRVLDGRTWEEYPE